MLCFCSNWQCHRLASLPMSLFNNCPVDPSYPSIEALWMEWFIYDIVWKLSHVNLVEASLKMIPALDFPKRSREVVSLSFPASSLPLLPTDVGPTDIPNMYSGCKISSWVYVPGRTPGNLRKPPVCRYFSHSLALSQSWSMFQLWSSQRPNQHNQKLYESISSFQLKGLSFLIFKIVTQSSSFMASWCSKEPWGGWVQMVPCHWISAIDQDNNCLEFAAKYSKKCWIYHLPAPKWYCYNKPISSSTPWFNGLPDLWNIFYPRPTENIFIK